MNTIPQVLYLEDTDEWAEELVIHLGDEFKVVRAKDVDEALTVIKEQDIEFVIADISLIQDDGSDQGGFNFLSYIQESELYSSIPVAILSAYTQFDNVHEAFKEYEIVDFFDKASLDVNSLKNIIVSKIGGSREQRILRESINALVIDDNAEYQSAIKEILEEEGCIVDVASDYSEALEKITTNQYYIATVDIRLSDLDARDHSGIELIDFLRRLGNTTNIIFISAYADENPEWIKQAAFEFYARDFIDKGQFNPQRLRLRIRRLMMSIVYLTVHIDLAGKAKAGKKIPLTVSISDQQSKLENSLAFAKPIISGDFRLDIIVQPFEIEVSPGSTQQIRVVKDEPIPALEYEITPMHAGKVQVMIDVYYQTQLLGRSILQLEATE